MRFSIGDLVVEKTVNHWYFTAYGYGFTMSPYYSEEDYWGEYYEKQKEKEPLIGLIIDIRESQPSPFFDADPDICHRTYKIMWLNTSPNDFMISRYFFGDELRLLSKINNTGVDDE